MSSPIAYQEIYKASMEDFVVPVYEVAPFTTIQNRAMVTRSLKAIAGVERIHVKGLNLLQNEFGSNGERVFEAENKDARVRFVGSGSSFAGVNGSVVGTIVANDFCEITFYGTGLNGLLAQDVSTREWRVSVDGGAEGANIIVANLSPVIYGRNYATHSVVGLASNLSLGWHTVRIRNVNINGLFFWGFEILNQRTDLAVYSGQGISNGSIQGLSALTTSAFKAGVVGTRGARVVKYIQGGVVSQAVQEVNAASAFLTLADHTNEEVMRRVNFREFGVNRADDFSTLTTSSNRAFTLDDGTTTLIALSCFAETLAGGGIEGLGVNAGAGTNYWTLTFTGTGLDIFASCDATVRTMSLTVDAVAQGTVTPPVSSARVIKLCSGLPYGSHTIKLTNLNAFGTFGTVDFIIYQPKKPSIPAGAFEVADYNVMADYVANATAGLETVGTGLLRKSNTRELTYVNTWAISAIDATTYVGGFTTNGSAIGSYVECTFFGTGFELRGRANTTYTGNATLRIDGNVNFSAFTSSAYGGFSIVSSTTGQISQLVSNTVGSGIRVSGLSLGLHTVRLTNNAALSMSVEAFDIITPIHSQESSLKVGSTSLKSVTKYSPEKSVANAGPDLSKAKAWVNFDSTTGKINGSYNISAALAYTAGIVLVYFEKPFKNNGYVGFAAGGTSIMMFQVGAQFKTPQCCEIITRNSAASPTNSTMVFGVWYGELDE